MEWDNLKHFLAAARTGSLTEAARTLKTSAATVGRHIDTLERQLGAKLFHRRPNGYTLTENGVAIRARAEKVEEAVIGVEREVFGRDRRAIGKVRVATTEDIAAMVIMPHLAAFRDAHPGISLEILGRVDLSSLRRRDADIALRTKRPDADDLVIRRIGALDFGMYASSSYVDANKLRPGKIDPCKLDLITWVEEMANLRHGPWMAEHAHGANVALRVNSTRLMYEACRAGLGAAILPCCGADEDSDMVCLIPPERVLSIDTWVVVHRDLSRIPRIRAVMDFLAALGPKLSRRKNEQEV